MSKGGVEVGPILKRSFKSLTEDPGFIGIYLLPFAVYVVAFAHMYLILGPLTPSMDWTPLLDKLILVFWWLILYAIVGLILTLTAYAGIILKTAARERGERMGFGAAVKRGLGFVPRLFVASILYALIVLVPPIVLFLLGFFVSPILIGAFLSLILALYIGVRLYLFGQACVIEDMGAVECLKRSWQITKGNFWLIFVTGLIFLMLSILIGLIPAMGSLIAWLVISPASIIAFTLIYLQLVKR